MIVKTYILDVKLIATFEVQAHTLKEAKQALRKQISGTDCLAGTWPHNGKPVQFTAGIDGNIDLLEVQE